MSRLVINPNSPQAWEIKLKPGTNILGRGFASDFKIDDPSVSGSHCQIVVNNGVATIKDLGSTNGTFLNKAQIQEAKLETGHAIRLGGIEMVFYGETAESVVMIPGLPPGAPARVSATAAAPSAAPAAPVARLSIAGSHRATAVSAPPPPQETEDAGAPPPIAPPIQSGPRFCKFHPKSLARWLCNKCNRTFCDLCVTSRNVAGVSRKLCRTCGVELAPLQMTFTQAARRSFYASIPGAFIYPFRGAGSLILICATIVYAILDMISAGLISILAKILFFGFLFLFMQNILHSTASDENDTLSLPDASGILSGAFQLLGTIVLSFGLPIALGIARITGMDAIPVSAIIATAILGCVYFPMAFLAVAMKDTVMAANPLIVFPSMLKVPFQYLVAVVLVLCVFGVRQLGSIMSGIAGDATFSTREMSVLFLSLGVQAGWKFASVYLLTVAMRILGLFYNSNKEELGWF